jgi:hypothetical protein
MTIRRATHTEKTAQLIANNIIPNTKSEVVKILTKVRGSNHRITCRKLYDYCKSNFKYELDRPGYEEIRSPKQTIKDKKADCEDYAIFIAACLLEMNYPATLRIADYGDGFGWSHIYVVSKGIIIDPVNPTFDEEIKPKKKLDFEINSQSLGLGRINNQSMNVKTKAPAKPKATKEDKDKAKLTKLKAELSTVKAQVVANAKFKAKIGDELTKYLKSNGLDKQIGLSGIPDEIKKTETSLKFYKGLLAGDKADFKSIGKRVGIIYQVKPLPKSKKVAPKTKSEPKKETPKEPEFEKIWLSYSQYKGSGKAWIANVNEDGKVLSFLDADVVEKDGYRGRKLFKVPLVEGNRYKLNESGSKSSDDKWFMIVKNGKLIRD